MKVICAGWGRTGTRSLKRALEILNDQPSYHMQNILLSKKDAKLWHDSIFIDNKGFEWDRIYRGYGACLDFPSCNYYKELILSGKTTQTRRRAKTIRILYSNLLAHCV